ncbi:MAG TPA: hypothetical protein VIC07_14305 [Acidimicrobiia bacterium]|jgi:uncharacterized membrane protein
MTVLRLIHIVTGGFWAGGVMLVGWFVTPSAREAGPGAGPFMQALLRRRLPTIMIGSGVVTVLAGLWLWAIRMPSLDRWQGWALAVGALSAVVALVIGIGWQRPTAKKVQVLGAAIAASGSPPTPEQGVEMGRLQARMAGYGSTLAYLLALALAGMALGGS